MGKILIRNLIIISSCFLALPSWASQENFSNLFVFGDSLSDTGNFASINGPFPNPPFFNNRATNGLTAVDLLAQSLNLTADPSLHLIGPAIGTNYAVVGARTGGSTALDLPVQVSSFAANIGGVAPKDALYVVHIGGNDVRDARDTADQAAAEQIIIYAVQNEIKQIKKLINLGAYYIVVVNSADIGLIPETTLIAKQLGNNQFAARATQLSKLFNKRLKRQLKSLKRNYDIELERFDLFDEFEELLEDAKKESFNNTTDACFSTVTLSFNTGCNFGANFDQFIFFDEIHPTARATTFIGKELIEEVSELSSDDD